MKKVCCTLLLLAGTTLSYHAFAQSKAGHICFIRTNGYVGSMVNNSVFIDDTLVCKLKNGQFSIHDVAPGDHTVAVEDSGLSSHKKSAPFTVTVAEDKTTYVNISWADKLTCEEITKSSADVKMKKAKQNNSCLKSK